MYCVDSSIRFFNNKTDLIFKKVQETGGIGFILTWRVSIFAVTMNETANYLITDKNKQKSTMQSLAGIYLFIGQEKYMRTFSDGPFCVHLKYRKN